MTEATYHFFDTHTALSDFMASLSEPVAHQWSRYGTGIFRRTPEEELGDKVVVGVLQTDANLGHFKLSISQALLEGNHTHFFDNFTRTPRFLNGAGGPQVSEMSFAVNHARMDTAQYSAPLRSRTKCADGHEGSSTDPMTPAEVAKEEKEKVAIRAAIDARVAKIKSDPELRRQILAAH